MEIWHVLALLNAIGSTILSSCHLAVPVVAPAAACNDHGETRFGVCFRPPGIGGKVCEKYLCGSSRRGSGKFGTCVCAGDWSRS